MNKINYSQRFGKKVFRGATVKEAYMSACKWYASNIIAGDKFHGVQVEYIKDAKDNSVTMVLYASLPEGEVMDNHCQVCKEMHRAFFINQDNDCTRCSALGYKRRLESKIAVKVDYYKELLRKIVNC